MQTLKDFLAKAKLEAAGDCRTLLISGEDFENAIVDLELARSINSLGRAVGFDSVRWVVVVRNTLDYATSIYSELSKHGIVLSLDTVISAARQRGTLYASTNKYDYIFALDYSRFALDFRSAVDGRVTEYAMSEFVKDFAGAVLLRDLLSSEGFDRFALERRHPEHGNANTRLSKLLVEMNYSANALGKQGWTRQRRWKWLRRVLLWPMARVRLAQRNSHEREASRR